MKPFPWLQPFAIWGGAIAGALGGFAWHGVGGGILGAPLGALAGWLIGSAVSVVARPLVGAARTVGIIAMLAAILWLVAQLWDVGRP